MDIFGRVLRFKVNRPLTETERQNMFGQTLSYISYMKVPFPHHDYLSPGMTWFSALAKPL